MLSPVLVVDALGMSSKIDRCRDPASLGDLATELEGQFHRFRSKVPHRLVFVGRKRVFGTGEFSSMRLNDMFILYSGRTVKDLPGKYLVASSIIYHELLRSGFIVRGGLGFGPVVRHRDLFIGRGFLDAYRMAEKRGKAVRDVCGILVSPSLYMLVSWSEHWCRLLCFYEDHCFLHPMALADPQIGEFDEDRILRCLSEAGANSDKLKATRRFLKLLENYDDAVLEGSRLRQLTGWKPQEERTEPQIVMKVDDPLQYDDWTAVWVDLARARGQTCEPLKSDVCS